jgi:hypothetical protein
MTPNCQKWDLDDDPPATRGTWTRTNVYREGPGGYNPHSKMGTSGLAHIPRQGSEDDASTKLTTWQMIRQPGEKH